LRFHEKAIYKLADKTTHEVLRSLTENESLIKVLTGQYGDYGLTKRKVLHARIGCEALF
jgi:all-trans-retinol 13,14-reductase